MKTECQCFEQTCPVCVEQVFNFWEGIGPLLQDLDRLVNNDGCWGCVTKSDCVNDHYHATQDRATTIRNELLHKWPKIRQFL